MPPFVTYSLLALCAAVVLFGVWVERKPEDDRRFGGIKRFAWVLQVGAFVAAYFVLRPGAAPNDPREALKQATASHTPVFLDMYSNY